MAATSIASLMRSATRCGRGLVPALEAVSGGGIHIHSARSAAGACTRLATAVEAHAASRVMRSHASSPTAFLIGSVRTGASLSLSECHLHDTNRAQRRIRAAYHVSRVRYSDYLFFSLVYAVVLSPAAVSVAGLLPLETASTASLPRVAPTSDLHLIADLSDDDGT